MQKQISKIKTIVLGILEKELITVLALGVMALGVWFANAATDSTELGITILDAGTITVTAPNGSEDWQIDSTQHITWDTTGSIANVKIELQRSTGGSWETLVSSTANDEDYPWVVTSPATTTATVRISSVNVPAIIDSSDAVFTISAAVAGSSSGGYSPTYPVIDSISPMSFYYDTATELTMRGIGFQNWAWITLNQVVYQVQKPHERNLMLIDIQPNTLTVGDYRLCVYNSYQEFDCYMHLINVIAVKGTVLPPTTGGGGGAVTYLAELVRQSSDITLQPREKAIVWVEYKNTGTATWYQDGNNPVRLGTDSKHDRRSSFYDASWIKKNRPVLVNKVVAPGEIGRFEFTIKAPWRNGKYVEYFAPVAEWKTWVGGRAQVKYTFTVKTLKRNWLGIPVIQPNVNNGSSTPLPVSPSTGGSKVDLPFQPKGTLLFSDNVEKIYQKITQTISRFFYNSRN